jgi:hypothetical protein
LGRINKDMAKILIELVNLILEGEPLKGNNKKE